MEQKQILLNISDIKEHNEIILTEEIQKELLDMPRGAERLEIAKENIKHIQAYKFTYNSSGRKVKGYLTLPREYENEVKFPVVILNRGGSKHVSQWQDGHMLNNLVCKYVKWGCAVITTQYSGNDGSEGRDEFGGMDLEDILNLKNIIDKHPNLDSEQIAMSGSSRGGLMTYMSIAKVDWIKVAIACCGTTEMAYTYSYREDLKSFHLDMYNTESLTELENRSPVKWANKLLKTPILIMHCSDDNVVKIEESLNLVLELQKLQGYYKFISYPEGGHFFGNITEQFNRDQKEWLEKYIALK